jgi:hypothetical protein
MRTSFKGPGPLKGSRRVGMCLCCLEEFCGLTDGLSEQTELRGCLRKGGHPNGMTPLSAPAFGLFFILASPADYLLNDQAIYSGFITWAAS